VRFYDTNADSNVDELRRMQLSLAFTQSGGLPDRNILNNSMMSLAIARMESGILFGNERRINHY
jgi:ABC-type proline/glycine betaine transport system ATPase subunit